MTTITFTDLQDQETFAPRAEVRFLAAPAAQTYVESHSFAGTASSLFTDVADLETFLHTERAGWDDAATSVEPGR